MEGFYSLKGVLVTLVVLLAMSSGARAAWPPFSTSSNQSPWHKTSPTSRAVGNGYSSYQQPQSVARPVYTPTYGIVRPVYTQPQSVPRQVYTPVQGNQYPAYNPGYRQTMPAFFRQSLAYQGYRLAPEPTSCPSCPAAVCPTLSCPAPVAAPVCPAPVVAPVCPILSCPAPVAAPVCPAPVCPAPVAPPVCPAPVVPPVCPLCPDPVLPTVCPEVTPAPTTLPPVVTLAPTTAAPTTIATTAAPTLSAMELGILDYTNWECQQDTNAFNVPISSCTVIGSTPSASAATASCPNWVLPVFCDSAVNAKAIEMSALLPPPPAVPIPSGYTLVANLGHFKVYTSPMKNFADAATACASEGAMLAVPQSSDDYQPIYDLAMAASGFASGFYIGLTDNDVENDFQYSLTGQRVCMTGLFKHQAAYATLPNEHCATLAFARLPDIQDVPCSWVLPYICQIPLASRYLPAPCA